MSEMDRDLFREMTVAEFAERLGSGDPTPGGGAAAALESALGAALIMMVANHTIGKEKYAEFEELNIRARDEASELRARLLSGIDRDAECFGKVTEAYRLPKSLSELQMDRVSAVTGELRSLGYEIADSAEEGLTDELIAQIDGALKKRRSSVICKMSVEAADAPLAVMEDSLRGLEIAEGMLGKSNANLVSDIYVAALSLSSGLRSASYNVDANLPAIRRSDADAADRLSLRAAEIKKAAEEIADRITAQS